MKACYFVASVHEAAFHVSGTDYRWERGVRHAL
jgi:hypothetical protein